MCYYQITTPLKPRHHGALQVYYYYYYYYYYFIYLFIYLFIMIIIITITCKRCVYKKGLILGPGSKSGTSFPTPTPSHANPK